MTQLLEIFVDILGPVALVVGLGAVAGSRLTLDAPTLAKLSYWILGPAFIFDILSDADLALGLVVRMVGATLVGMAGVGILVGVVGKLTGRTYGANAAGILTSIYANVGNFGLAIVAFTFGTEALALAGIVLLPVNVVGIIFGVGAATSQRAAPLSAARTAFTAPLVLAVPPAVVVNAGDLTLPVWADRPVTLLSAALIPMMLLTLGVQLAGMRMPRLSLDIAIPITGKLIVAPLIAAGAAIAFGLSGIPAGVVVLQAAMPAAVFTALIAIEHDLEPDLVTTIVLAGTVASMVTLPVVIALVR